ncbi:MAG TPA: Nif3-like dinuclear metal center hexameric protein [Mycobacteriales bacterium]|nr:Nif3-like dinuclear metal center hexameric protein [Mycobacteriales bacterium]
MATLGEVVALLSRRYDPSLAESWDAVGLVCGDPDAEVERVHFAIDPVEAVADEAIASGARLLVTHHPLYLGGTTSVAATSSKGRVVHRLISAGIGLYVAHTNADVANPGVNDALAAVLGLQATEPLSALPHGSLDKVVTFVPVEDAEGVLDALAAAGAGTIGDYTRCAYLGEGTGTFTPGLTSSPVIGEPGKVEQVKETRLETIAPRRLRAQVIRALLASHPYEEPAYDVTELAAVPGGLGLGRLGDLAEPTTLASFTTATAAALPATSWGVRAAGDPGRAVRTVAVCGGSGGSLAAAAAARGADVLVTSDLKHHSTSEAAADLGIALIDAAHWATEAPWLDAAAALLAADAAAEGTTVVTTVSRLVTDPWTVHAHSVDPTPAEVS